MLLFLWLDQAEDYKLSAFITAAHSDEASISMVSQQTKSTLSFHLKFRNLFKDDTDVVDH